MHTRRTRRLAAVAVAVVAAAAGAFTLLGATGAIAAPAPPAGQETVHVSQQPDSGVAPLCLVMPQTKGCQHGPIQK